MAIEPFEWDGAAHGGRAKGLTKSAKTLYEIASVEELLHIRHSEEHCQAGQGGTVQDRARHSHHLYGQLLQACLRA